MAAGLLAGGLSVTSANAADLGGNCCADLEERIAELEATTVRKGNRKVSLTISGWVAEQVTYWDDGHESNTYVGGIGTTLGTNVKFTGQATISPGWSAGYVIHLEMDGSDTLVGTDQFTPDGPGLFTTDNPGNLKGGHPNYVQALQSFWFMKSDHLGKVSVGLQSMAADNAAILVDGSGSLVVANWVGFNTEGFFMRRNDANANPNNLDTPETFGRKRGPATTAATAMASRSTASATTLRPITGSRRRPGGARTTTGIRQFVLPVSTMAGRWPLLRPMAS